MRVAVVQMQCSGDGVDDRSRAAALVADAAVEGAALVVLPELFASLGSARAMRTAAEPLEGVTVGWAREVARDTGVWLVAGSFVERGDRELFNTSPLLSPAGELVAVYRKIHLFDVEVEGAGTHESDVFTPGEQMVLVGVDDLPLGMTTCYDLRFPELFRALTLRGAELIVLPSACTAATGVHHWEPLLRARAIENQVFVVAPDQCGTSPDGIVRHGHSMVVDPWGRVLGDAGHEEIALVVDLDFDELVRARRAVPSLANRRPAAYDWPI
jgi:predicted amidohydrolase